ncbi:MAG: PepSY-associated TM helix domain-containing protein [Burkholderiaceae bacterium]
MQRASWLRHLYRWHWVSAAVSLVGLVLFAFTGFTLNHAADIEARAVVQAREANLPAVLLAGLQPADDDRLPQAVSGWLAQELEVEIGQRPAEWSEDEAYVSMPRPGGDAWLRIDRESGLVEYEDSDRGWIAWLNDLHKGRHAGPAWGWFIDIFAAACLVFALTGLLILGLHARNRPMAWPLLALGAVLPALVLLLFVH